MTAHTPNCAECRAAGDSTSPALYLIRGAKVNPDTGRAVPFRKNVCLSHYDMLTDDTARIQIVRRYT